MSYTLGKQYTTFFSLKNKGMIGCFSKLQGNLAEKSYSLIKIQYICISMQVKPNIASNQ